MSSSSPIRSLLRATTRQLASPASFNHQSSQVASRYRCPLCAVSTVWRRPSTAQTRLRTFHTEPPRLARPPKSRDRGPRSTEDTQTDFADMNVLRNIPSPSTAIDACTDTGFHLNSGVKIIDSGVLLLSGQAFNWKPWLGDGSAHGTIHNENKNKHPGLDGRGGALLNAKGQLEIQKDAWGILELVWPKPDLLILGTGPSVVPLSPKTRKQINDLGIRIEVQDTHNAAAQFNLLATERGLQQVAAALVPIGWKE